MKAAATSFQTLKINAGSKENPKGRGFNTIQIESNLKPSFNLLPTSARQHFSSLIDSNTPNNLKSQILSSAFASKKLANSNSIQHAVSNSNLNNGSRVNSQISTQNALFESKKNISIAKSQLDSNKSPSFGKVETESSKIGVFSKKSDFFAVAQEFNKSHLKAKTKSQAVSKGESLILEISNNPVETRKERLFGSYEPTPTNSPSKRPMLRTEASGSDKKGGQDFDIKEYLTFAKKVASPTTRLFTIQDHGQTNVERFNSSRINHFLNQRINNFVSIEKSPSNLNSSQITKANFNELRSVNGKSNERSVNKGNARLLDEQDYKKHNTSNDSLKFGKKSATSTKPSNSLKKNNTIFSHLDEGNKVKQTAHASNNVLMSPSALYQRLGFPKETSSVKQANVDNIEIKAQEIRPKNSENGFDENIINQASKGTAHNKVSFGSDRSSNNKGISFTAEINNRLTLVPNNISSSKPIEIENFHENDKGISGLTFKGSRNLSSYSKPTAYFDNHKVKDHHHVELENFANSQFSQNSSKNISRPQSSGRILQENFDSEKKKAESVKNRISLHLDSLKLSKIIAEYSNRLSDSSTISGKLYENQSTFISKLGKNFPKSTKNSTSSSQFDFGTALASHHHRGTSLDNASSLIKQPKIENPNRSSLPSSTFQTLVIHTDDDTQSSRKNSPILTLENETFSKNTEAKTEKDIGDASPIYIDIIDFEEIPMTEAERRINSIEKKQIYHFESDHTDFLHSEIDPATNNHTTEATNQIEKNSKVNKSESNAENGDTTDQLQKALARMKSILEIHRTRETEWKRERMQMQERIEELENLLFKQVTS